MAVLLFAMTTAVMGCYQKETEPIEAVNKINIILIFIHFFTADSE